MKQLDQSFRAFRRLQDLSQVKLLPSEYVMKHIKLTPFAGEDIGWLLNNGAEDLLMFASDYPHHEGTDDPIARFEKTMIDTSEEKKLKFYSRYFFYFKFCSSLNSINCFYNWHNNYFFFWSISMN